MSDTIKLMSDLVTEDEYGNQIQSTDSTEVFAEVMSVSASEFFNAGEAGHKPAFRFDVFFGDYNGEQRVEYKDEVYYIYRTYLRGDIFELYAERRVGL